MNARFHRGLGWIFFAAIASLAACTGEPEAKKPTPGAPTPGAPTPGAPTPGTPTERGRRAAENVECLGPSNLTVAKREELANRICSAEMGRARGTARSRCANVFTMRSDAQIVGLLSAHDDEIIRQSTAAQQEASDPTVRDLAHLLVSAHTRLRTEQNATSRRAKIQPEPTAESRAFGGGLHAEYGAIMHGEGFDRDFVARQVEQQHRAMLMLDAIAPQAKNSDLHCHIEAARVVTEAELDQACWVWSSMGNVTGRQIAGGGRRVSGRIHGEQGTETGQGTEGTEIGQGTEGTEIGQGTEVGGTTETDCDP